MDAEDLRLAVYRAFAETGRAPRSDELARQLGAGVQEVTEGLDELARGVPARCRAVRVVLGPMTRRRG